MSIEENRSLRELTTLKVGGTARYVLTCTTHDDIETALAFTRERGLPFVVLGEGSNVLPSDEPYIGTILLMRLEGIEYRQDSDTTLLVTVGAGVSWDECVEEVVKQGLWGLENLAGIPGTVGAAPVQNIGAYGMEAKQSIVSVAVYDTATGKHYSISNEDSGFGYRDSRYKHEPNLIITSVTFRVHSEDAPRIEYSDLQAAHTAGVPLTTPKEIADAVRTIRRRKFPDLTTYGTAGSFFKNPILTQETFTQLSSRFGALPSFPAVNGIKIPLAFILDKVLDLKGYKRGHTFLFGNQPLVLVAEAGATAEDVNSLAGEIERRVQEEVGITIEREVRNLSSHQSF